MSDHCNVDYLASLCEYDFFFDWFESPLDLDEGDNFISESLEQSPRSETDETWMIIRATCDDYAESETQGQSTFIILDSGSDVSILPDDFAPGDSTKGGISLRMSKDMHLELQAQREQRLWSRTLKMLKQY